MLQSLHWRRLSYHSLGRLMTIVQILFSTRGRLRRRDYWISSVGIGVVGGLIEFVGHQFLTEHPASEYFKDLSGWMAVKPSSFGMFVLAMMIVVQWPVICLGSKRWHDRGKPGWLSALSPFTTLLLFVAQYVYGPMGTHFNLAIYSAIILISFPINIWVFVECGCLDGTRGVNRYGPSPKGIQDAAATF